MRTNVTMKDVASQAGVSMAVVSRVLNDREGVKPETRQHVLAVMRDLAYEPDTRGRGTASAAHSQQQKARTGRILFLSGNSDLLRIPPVYMAAIGGVESCVRENGMAFELKCLPGNASFPVDEIAASVDGVVLLNGENRSDVRELASKVPCVKVMGAFTQNTQCDHVSYDNVAVGQLAAEHLLRQGHRRTVVLRYDYESQLFAERQHHFAAAIHRAGGTVTSLHVSSAGGDWSLVEKNAADVLRDADGIFVVAAVLYAPLQRWYDRHACTMPEVVVCNFDIPYLRTASRIPAVIDIHGEEVGRRAVQQLLWRMAHRSQLAERVLVNVELIESPTILTAFLEDALAVP